MNQSGGTESSGRREQRGESGQEVWKHRGVMKQLAKVSDGREGRARQGKRK